MVRGRGGIQEGRGRRGGGKKDAQKVLSLYVLGPDFHPKGEILDPKRVEIRSR